MTFGLDSLVWTQLMWAQLWQVTLLGLVVLGTVRWLAADRPHLAHALWLLVLIKCLTPPVLASPTSPFSWLQARNQSNSATQSGTETYQTDLSDSSRHANSSTVVIRTNLFAQNKLGNTDFESPQEPALKIEQAGTRSRPGRSMSFSWPIVFALLWLGGAAINLIVTSIRFLWFWKSNCLGQFVAQPKLEQSVSKWSHEFGLKQSVRIRVLDSPIGPAVVGLFRPMILLPLVLVEGRSEKDLKPLLAHELIHIRRGDLFWAMIQTLAGCLFWFHPLVRWGVRMVTQESERSCDEETVASLGCSPVTYARCLLDVLELKQSLRVAPAVPGIRPVDITSNRMERIMKLGQGCQKRTPLWVWLVMLASGSIVLPGAALVFGQDGEPSSSGSLLPMLESQEVTSSEAARDPMRVESYDVADLLKQADEFGDQNLKPSVKLLEAFSKRDRNANRSLKATVKHTDSDGNVEEIVLGDSEPNLKVVDTRLYIYGTDEFHRNVQAGLIQLRETGFKFIEIELLFITADSNALKALGLDWDLPKPESELGANKSINAVETVGAITTMPEVKFDLGTVVDENFKQAAYEVPIEIDLENIKQLLPAYPDADQLCVPAQKSDISKLSRNPAKGLQRVHSSSYSTKRNEEIDALLKGLIDHKDTVLTQAPKIRVLSGGNATVLIGQQRPFVIGIRRNEQDKKTLQPVVGCLQDGLKVNLSPLLQSNGSVRLQSQLLLARLESCEPYILDKSWSTGEKGDPTIQLPIASFLGFSTEVELLPGQALVLETRLPEARPNDKVPSVAIIRCKVVDNEAEAKNRLPYPNPTLLEPQPFKTKVPAEVGYLMEGGRSLRMTRGYAENPNYLEGYEAMVIEPMAAAAGEPEAQELKPEVGLPVLSNLSNVERDRLFTNVGIDDGNRKLAHESQKAASPQQDILANIPYVQRLFRNSAGSLPIRENANGVDVDFIEQKEAATLPLTVRSKDENKNHGTEPIIVKPKDLGVELRLETTVERVEKEDGMSLRGQQLIFELEDLTLSCEQGELELKNDGSYLFSGQKVCIEQVELRADVMVITKKPTEQTIVELRGNSELTLDDRRLKADKIKIFSDGGLIYLEGAASISKVFTCLDAQGRIREVGEALTVGKKLVFGFERETALIIEP